MNKDETDIYSTIDTGGLYRTDPVRSVRTRITRYDDRQSADQLIVHFWFHTFIGSFPQSGYLFRQGNWSQLF